MLKEQCSFRLLLRTNFFIDCTPCVLHGSVNTTIATKHESLTNRILQLNHKREIPFFVFSFPAIFDPSNSLNFVHQVLELIEPISLHPTKFTRTHSTYFFASYQIYQSLWKTWHTMVIYSNLCYLATTIRSFHSI